MEEKRKRFPSHFPTFKPVAKAREVSWTDPQTGKKWYRKGECTHCGACCSLWCPHLKWVALRDIKKGEVFSGTGVDSGNIRSFCDIFDNPVDVKTDCVQCKYSTRQEYPRDPLSTPKCCGYYWVDEGGKKWVRKEQHYELGKRK